MFGTSQKNSTYKLGIWLLAGLLLMLPTVGFAQVRADAEGVPEIQGEFLNDYTGKITGIRKVEISANLRKGSRVSRLHPVLVVMNKLGDFPKMPQKIDDFAVELAQKWKDKLDNIGVLILVPLESRKVFVAKDKEVPQSLADSIVKEMLTDSVKKQLRGGNITQAMYFGSQGVQRALTDYGTKKRGAKKGRKGAVAGGTKKTVTRTTRTRTRTRHPRRSRRSVSRDGYMISRPKRNRGVSIMAWLCPLMIVVFIIIAVIAMFAGRRHGYGGGAPVGYGGGGYGYGGGGGGFFSGMMTGGMLGYMFGGGFGGHGYGGGYGGGYGDGGYSETTETYTETSYDGGGYDGGGGDWGGGGGFDDGGFDSYGGDFDGGGSFGEW